MRHLPPRTLPPPPSPSLRMEITRASGILRHLTPSLSTNTFSFVNESGLFPACSPSAPSWLGIFLVGFVTLLTVFRFSRLFLAVTLWE